MPVTSTPSAGFTSGAASSLTISHTSDANPLYVLLTWFVSAGGTDAVSAVSGITYNGVALTRGGHSAVSGNTMEWWRLAAPAVGTANLVLTLSSSRRISAGVINLSGWPSDILDHNFSAAGGSATPPPVSVSSRLGAEVLSWIGFNDPTQNVTEPSGSSALWNQELTGGGSGGGGDQVSAAVLADGATPNVTMTWAGSVTAEVFGVAALSFVLTVGTSSGNLLTGATHTVTGSNNFIAGSDNEVAGDISEVHGTQGTVAATRSVLFSQDGSPHTLSADGVVSIFASDVLFNGTSVKNAITALTSDVTATGPGSVAATIANDAVTNAKAANMAQATLKGRAAAAGTGDPTDLTPDQASTILDGASDPLTRKTYVDGLAANIGKRATVRAATTANITIATALNNGDTLDGVSLVTGDLVLVKDQSTGAENGVYVVGVSPVRDAQFDTYNEHPGSLLAVQEGTANADTLWLCTSNVGGTLNTTAITFSSLSVSGGITQLTGDVTAGPGSGSQAATIANDAVTNAKAANMAQSTIKGRAVGAGTGDPTDLTATQATAILDNMVGDSGSGGTKGLVPAPASGDAAAARFLKADGSWTVPSGTGLETHFIVKSGNESRTSNTTLSDDSELLFAIGANATWFVEVWLLTDGATTGDWQGSLRAPTGAIGWWSGIRTDTTPTGQPVQVRTSILSDVSPTASGVGLGTLGAGTPTLAYMSGLVVNGSTSGNVTLAWAQGSSNGTATRILANTTMRYTKL